MSVTYTYQERRTAREESCFESPVLEPQAAVSLGCGGRKLGGTQRWHWISGTLVGTAGIPSRSLRRYAMAPAQPIQPLSLHFHRLPDLSQVFKSVSSQAVGHFRQLLCFCLRKLSSLRSSCKWNCGMAWGDLLRSSRSVNPRTLITDCVSIVGMYSACVYPFASRWVFGPLPVWLSGMM